MPRKALPDRKTLLFIGVALALLGVLLLLSPAAVGEAVIRLVAIVLAVVGLVQLVHGLRARSGVHRFVSGALGLIVIAVGVLVWINPEQGSGFLTALLMIFFVVNGLWKISLALRFRPLPGWLWLLFGGLVSLVFVYLLWRQWPLAGAWAIGVLVGADLLLSGIGLMVLSLRQKKSHGSDFVDTINL